MQFASIVSGLLIAPVFLLHAMTLAYCQQPVASFYYDERGNVIRQEQDTNGDGKMDRWTH